MARGKIAIRPLAKSIIINGNDHILGRLAATVAKHLLRGDRITVVRCEGLILSGPFRRNKLKFVRWFNKRHVTNPKRGPFHFRGPAHIFTRVVRGMIPYTTKRGAAAMRRLVAIDGVPPPFDKKKAYVCPRALRKLRLDPSRTYCTLGRVSSEVGWQHRDTVARLEEKRKVRSAQYYEQKKKDLALRAKVARAVDGKLASAIGQEKAALLARLGLLTA